MKSCFEANSDSSCLVPQNSTRFLESEMIKIIRSTDSSSKQDYLESAIGAYYDINHQLEGELNSIRTSKFTKQHHKQEDIQDVLDKTKTHLPELLNNLKKGFRASMDS